MTYEEYCASVARDSFDLGDAGRRLSEAADLLKTGQEYARASLMWEGDDNGPRFSVIPTGDDEAALVIAWKQINNGTTFVVSEHPMPWLR